MTHELKCWPEPFAARRRGEKRFEIRKADRPFALGDTLVLCEWNPSTREFTGSKPIRAKVTYIAQGSWGLPSDICVMSISKDAA